MTSDERRATGDERRPRSAGSSPVARRSSLDTGFRPTKHGFPFPNRFPCGSPVVTVRTPFGRLCLGDAAGGLCGGMAFAALDGYLAGAAVPREPTPEVVRGLCRRLLDSWNLPFGVLKYYDWQRRPLGGRFLAGVRVRAGVTALTVEEEWPKVKAVLDAGLPAPLGLVQAESWSPWHLPRNHQVLAYGYDLDDAAGGLTLRVYDPNHALDDGVTLRLSLADPDAGSPVEHSWEGATVRGFFLTEYRRPNGPPL